MIQNRGFQRNDQLNRKKFQLKHLQNVIERTKMAVLEWRLSNFLRVGIKNRNDYNLCISFYKTFLSKHIRSAGLPSGVLHPGGYRCVRPSCCCPGGDKRL